MPLSSQRRGVVYIYSGKTEVKEVEGVEEEKKKKEENEDEMVCVCLEYRGYY